MPFASHGVRATTRKTSNLIVHNNGLGGSSASRSIHIPASVRDGLHIRNSGSLGSPTQKLFTQSRNLLSRLFTHLTAPGLRVPSPHTARSLQSGLGNRATLSTIQSGLSFSARTTLKGGVNQGIFLPRAPVPTVRMTQVGLGTARNFSSSRPIFQNLIQNVPVAGRALYEVDLDLKIRNETDKMKREILGKKSTQKTKEMIKPSQKQAIVLTNEPHTAEAELDHYFPNASIPAVTTCLLIPLAPTPTSKVPLPVTPSHDSRYTLLPLSQLGSMHVDHTTHALRVSTLFTRLDQANVWARGVKCSAYSHGQANSRRPGDEGVCTVLKVEFDGWTKAEVRSVIGESGTGWCVLEEFGSEEDMDVFDETSSLFSGTNEDSELHRLEMEMSVGSGADLIDPSKSFVLPTLDFSSSFLAGTPSSPSSINLSSPSMSFNDSFSEFDMLSQSSRSSSAQSSLSSWVDPPSANGWFGVGFSSQFVDRSRVYEPRESMFY